MTFHQSQISDASHAYVQRGGRPGSERKMRAHGAWTLALDLGPDSGFAVGSSGAALIGTWALKRRNDGGAELEQLAAMLAQLDATVALGRVVVLESRRRNHHPKHRDRFVELVDSWCLENGLSIEVASAGSVKKAFTGNGNASSDLMFDQSLRRGFDLANDAEVAALATLNWALYNEPDAANNTTGLLEFQG